MNTANVNELNELKSSITYYCEEMIFHPFDEYQKSGCRILNAARIFYYNILFKKQIPFAESQNMKILKQIKSILGNSDTVPVKEQKIKELLEKEQLKPEEYLHQDEWKEQTDFSIL